MSEVEKKVRLFAQYEKIKLANMILSEAFEIVIEINEMSEEHLDEVKTVIEQHTTNCQQTEKHMAGLLKEINNATSS